MAVVYADTLTGGEGGVIVEDTPTVTPHTTGESFVSLVPQPPSTTMASCARGQHAPACTQECQTFYAARSINQFKKLNLAKSVAPHRPQQ